MKDTRVKGRCPECHRLVIVGIRTRKIYTHQVGSGPNAHKCTGSGKEPLYD